MLVAQSNHRLSQQRFAIFLIDDSIEISKWNSFFCCFAHLLSQNLMYFCSKIRRDMKLNRIKDVLDQKGISQTWLAKQVGKSFSTINSYACNRYQPDLETLLAISKILQVDLKDLITNENERQ